MSGRNLNLEAKAELGGFEAGAGKCVSRKKGGCLGGNVPPTDEVFFSPGLEGDLGGDEGASGNSGSKPTGTRFKS